MFVFHRDELHAHTLFGATSLDSGTSAYLTARPGHLAFREDTFSAGLNLMSIKCFETRFSAGVFSRNAFAETSCFLELF
jgi:hypothetical protein